MGIVIDYSSGFFEATPSGETVGSVSGNATLDLTSGNVFNHTPTANTTFAFSNPPASGTGQAFTLKLTGANVTEGYDIPNISTDATTDQFDTLVTTSQDVLIRDNGTDLFILEYAGVLKHFTLATAFDITSTATLVTSLDLKGTTGTGLSSSASDFRAFTISPDGTQVLIRADNPTIRICQFSLATAWDLSSTKTHVGNWTGIASTSFNDSRGVRFANNGSIVTLGGNNTNRSFGIAQLSTPYDITSVSSSVLYDLNTDFGYTTRTSYWVWGSYYSSDGKKLIISSTLGYEVVLLLLATPFDPSSYTSMTEHTITDLASLHFISDGTKAISERNTATGDFAMYSTSGATALATIAYPSSVEFAGGTAPDAPANGETDILSFYTTDGGTTYYGFKAGDAMA